MSDRLPPLNALRAFEAAARLRSFKHAAEELFVTPAAISQQIKTLEDYLGVTLFRRLTRAIELTTAAEALLPKLREGFDCFSAGLAQARRAEDRGKIAVSSPPNFAARWLMPRLRLFTAAYPQFDLRIIGTLRAIDSPEHDQPADAGRADDEARLVVRYGKGDYPGSEVALLFRPSYVPVCSPKLLGRGPPLRNPSDLANHTLIHDESSPGDEERPGWEEWIEKAGAKGIDVTRGPRFSNASLAHEAAIDGVGVALVLRPLVDSDIEDGRLVVPIELSIPSQFAYYLVMSEAFAEHAAANAFWRWITDQAQIQARRRR